MIDRRHIEQILRLNGLSPTAADEEIRSVLISARWQKEDVETAITVLRENVNTHQSRVDTLHDVFMTDKHLDTEQIQALLGIDMKVGTSDLDQLRASRRHMYVWQIISIFLLAIVIALGFILTMMYMTQSGIFYVHS